MKNRLLVSFLLVLLIIGCKFDNQSVVKEIVSSFNSGNSEKVSGYISDDFEFIMGKEESGSEGFLQVFDSLSLEGYQVTDSVLSISDSLVVSTIIVSSPEDISLGVKPLRKYEVKWYFSKKKLAKIQVDEDETNNATYRKSLKKARAPYEQWVEEKKAKDNTPKNVTKPVSEKSKEVTKTSNSELLEEYSSLSDEEKEAVQVRAALSGIFFCSKCYFEKLDFKNDTSVVVYDSILGFPVNYTFKINGRLVTIKKDKKEFVFDLVNWETLIGKTKGATGEYKKLRESN